MESRIINKQDSKQHMYVLYFLKTKGKTTFCICIAHAMYLNSFAQNLKFSPLTHFQVKILQKNNLQLVAYKTINCI